MSKRLWLSVGDDKVDLMQLPALTVGFKAEFFAATKINYGAEFTPQQEAVFMLFMLHKLRPETTVEEVHAMPLGQIGRFYEALTSINTQVFDPVGLDNPRVKYVPASGQPGKDVVWVPTPVGVLTTMLDLASVGSGDVLIDLGSGDGRTVCEAARRGAVACGVEWNPDMLALARARAGREEFPVGAQATFEQGDIFDKDLSSATVITLYLLPVLNLRLRERLLALKTGTRIISHQFDMGGWEPDETVVVGTKLVHKWVV